MSVPRFYFPQLTRPTESVGSFCTLDGPEAKHATSVLRLGEGDQVELFNGRGDCVRAAIVSSRKGSLDLEYLSWQSSDGQADLELTLLIALPKGDRQRVLIDAVTELGVARLIPLITQRGVAQPTDSALERLERTVIEACKQCGRNQLMEIAPPQGITSLATNRPQSATTLDLVAHPYAGQYELRSLTASLTPDARQVNLLIGPEGGLTQAEIDALAAAGWQVVTLGKTILRIEVAAIAAVAQILAKYPGGRSSC